jgi:hypothetical protein
MKSLAIAMLLLLAVPSPQPTIPIDYDAFCAQRGLGHYEGWISNKDTDGVILICEKARCYSRDGKTWSCNK